MLGRSVGLRARSPQSDECRCLSSRASRLSRGRVAVPVSPVWQSAVFLFCVHASHVSGHTLAQCHAQIQHARTSLEVGCPCDGLSRTLLDRTK